MSTAKPRAATFAPHALKDSLTRLARHSAWANRALADAIKNMDEARLDTETPSSFPTLRKTVAHLRAAEQIWLERLQLVERPVWMGEELEGNFTTLCDAWLSASDGLFRFAEKQYNDAALLHVVEYRDLKKMLHKTPVADVLQHVFNHSAYHRGQLVTMMRAVGETVIPRTDFIHFVRLAGR